MCQAPAPGSTGGKARPNRGAIAVFGEVSETMKQFRNLVLLSVLLAIFTFWGGYTFGQQGYEIRLSQNPLQVGIKHQETEDRNLDFSLFYEVWDLLHREYLKKEELQDQDLMYGAVSGLTRSVGDPYTAFLTPEENEIVKAGINGEYEGIGAELGMRDNQLMIISPLEGSPAEAAGVEAGDKILKIDGEETRGITLSEAVSKIRGEAGTVVTLTLGRESREEPLDVSITRGRITLESVKWEPLDSLSTKLETGARDKDGGGIVYIRISRFGERTASEWDEAVAEILGEASPKALILDLRNNPGGILSASVELASEFIDRGTIVFEEFGDGTRKTFSSTRVGKFTRVPAVVLLNKGSASASEILASALRYHRRAHIVGEKSFGKGTVQDARDLPDGSGVHITVAKWLTPEGKWVNETGLTPDFEVALTKEDIEAERDPQLEKAVELINQ